MQIEFAGTLIKFEGEWEFLSSNNEKKNISNANNSATLEEPMTSEVSTSGLWQFAVH